MFFRFLLGMKRNFHKIDSLFVKKFLFFLRLGFLLRSGVISNPKWVEL